MQVPGGTAFAVYGQPVPPAPNPVPRRSFHVGTAVVGRCYDHRLAPSPLLVLGAPAGAAPPSAPRGGDDPAIQIWINNDRRFLPGDHAKVQVRTREDGYLLVLHVDPDGHLRVLFPLDPKDDDFVRGGRKYEIRGRGGRESFTADDGKGTGTVYAAVSHDPFRFDEFVLGDHWDYRNLAPQRLPADPEQDLNDLVRRMVDGSFDYDILTYTVLERVVYADNYGRPTTARTTTAPTAAAGTRTSAAGGRTTARRTACRSACSSAGLTIAGSTTIRSTRRTTRSTIRSSTTPTTTGRTTTGRCISRPYYNYPYYGGSYSNRYRGVEPAVHAVPLPSGRRSARGLPRSPLRSGRSVNTVYLPPVVRDRQAGECQSGPACRRRAAGRGTEPVLRPGGRGKAPTGEGTTARRAPERTPRRAAEIAGVDSRLVRPNIDARRAREPEEAPEHHAGQPVMPAAAAISRPR